MVKLIVPDMSFEDAADMVMDGYGKEKILTPQLAADIALDKAGEYQGYTFIVDGRLIQAKAFQKPFNRNVVKMVSVWQHTEQTFIIIVPQGVKYIWEGLDYINKAVRPYILFAERWLGV